MKPVPSFPSLLAASLLASLLAVPSLTLGSGKDIPGQPPKPNPTHGTLPPPPANPTQQPPNTPPNPIMGPPSSAVPIPVVTPASSLSTTDQNRLQKNGMSIVPRFTDPTGKPLNQGNPSQSSSSSTSSKPPNPIMGTPSSAVPIPVVTPASSLSTTDQNRLQKNGMSIVPTFTDPTGKPLNQGNPSQSSSLSTTTTTSSSNVPNTKPPVIYSGLPTADNTGKNAGLTVPGMNLGKSSSSSTTTTSSNVPPSSSSSALSPRPTPRPLPPPPAPNNQKPGPNAAPKK